HLRHARPPPPAAEALVRLRRGAALRRRAAPSRARAPHPPRRPPESPSRRAGYLCRAPYEWGQHVTIALASGLTDEEIARVAEGPDADGWSDDDALLLRAADELHADSRISDATWAPLSARWDTQQLIEVCMVVGQYHLVAMTLNSLGVEP